MKIIQPSGSFKKGKASNSDSISESSDRELVYKEVDIDFLSQNGKAQPSKKAKSKTEQKTWKPHSKRKHSEHSIGEPPNEEEFDFDTSKLEAMPKEEVAEPIIEGKKRRRSELMAAKASEPLELITDPAKKEFNELFGRGVRLLSMREHSVKELTGKLFDKSECATTIHAVVDELQEKKYLSDERFTESYIRARANRGFGPVKIRVELKSKGVNSNLIQDHLDEGAAIWFDNAQTQYQKKYGDAPISDYSVWSKRARFMQSRGFTMEQIQVTIPQLSSD